MKKWAFIMCCVMTVLSLGFLLTGCGNSNISLNAASEIIYNGNSAMVVGDNLYFGNGFDGETITSYDSAKTLSYLAKLNTNVAALNEKGNDYSPNGVQNLSSEVVANVSPKTFMFSVGNYIFYATPNTWVDNNGNTHFDRTTIYRSNLNGGDKKEIYSTRNIEDATISKIEALKFNGKFYIVMLIGTNLVKLNLENSSTQTISDVTSVAIPKTYQKNKMGSTMEWNGEIYYSKNSDNDNDYSNQIFKVSISDMTTGKSEKIKSINSEGSSADVLTFIDREVGYVGESLVDEIFCTRGGNIYKLTVEQETVEDGESEEENTYYVLEKVATGSATFVQRLLMTDYTGDSQKVTSSVGYIYGSETELNFVKSGSTLGNKLAFDGAEISSYTLSVIDGTKVILYDAKNIYMGDLSYLLSGQNVKVKIICRIGDDKIFTTNALSAYDGDYVYFYSKLKDVTLDEDDTDDKNNLNKDTNYYLFRASLAEQDYNTQEKYQRNYQVLGNTSYRHD